MGGVGCSVRRREEEMQQDAFGGSKTIRPQNISATSDTKYRQKNDDNDDDDDAAAAAAAATATATASTTTTS